MSDRGTTRAFSFTMSRAAAHQEFLDTGNLSCQNKSIFPFGIRPSTSCLQHTPAKTTSTVVHGPTSVFRQFVYSTRMNGFYCISLPFPTTYSELLYGHFEASKQQSAD